MLELKRFFRPPVHKKPQSIHPHPPITHPGRKPNRLSQTQGRRVVDSEASPVAVSTVTPGESLPTKNPQHSAHTQSAVPPSADSVLSLSADINIYHDDSILAQKYGKLGKTLGAGAGGSVKILVRPSDNAIFAVKEFRPRKTSESIKEYAKKCTAEFLVGSSLHHPNVVQTMDVFSDSKQNKYFEVMEYLPVDFFAVVMTGKMSRGEINCCFKQICAGVHYLHSMGLAHRDLKLDNCCMNDQGILKLIDFGSAVIFRYPFEQKITRAHGIVGSDPYLAPEVLVHSVKYDPQGVDIWSIGIIFCCMMLKRFPWKVPRDVDDNYRLYRQPDDEEHDYVESARHHEVLLQERRDRRAAAAAKAPGDDTIEGDTPDVNEEAGADPQDNDGESTLNNKAEGEGEGDVPDVGKLEIGDGDGDGDGDEVADEPVSIAVPEPRKPVQQAYDREAAATPTSVQESASAAVPTPTPSATPSAAPRHHHKKPVQGPYRLMRLLPHASRPIISRILKIDPAERATFADIYADEWFTSIPVCTMDIDKKTVQRAPGHHHTIVREENDRVHTYKV